MNNESIVISSILTEPDQYFLVQDILSVDDFSDPDLRMVWESMSDAVCKGIPANSLSNTGADKDIVSALSDAYYSTPSIIAYAKEMKSEFRRSRLVALIEKAKTDDNPVETLMQAIDIYSCSSETAEMSFKELMSETIDYLDAVNLSGSVGIPSGLSSIDERIGGWQAGRLIVVAARPSVGKTAITMQMALSAAMAGHKVGVMSLEMSAHELGVRTLSHVGRIDISKLFRAEEDALGSLGHAIGKIGDSDSNLVFNLDQYRLDEITNQIRIWVKRNNIELAFVDHIGLVEVPGSKNANERLSQITRTLKKLCKELDIPIVAVSQLNRENTKAARMPVLSDLRDSGSIEQDADICLFLHRDESNIDLPIYRLGLLKNRQGPAGWIANNGNLVGYNFSGKFQEFREISHGY